mmetsp:Transcript_12883/g.40882  ORF Transcript_12883/g.40882 Transcript_12883/m.40882 type:complete len:313 (+) Transcript_12883:267-1205(+)
MEEADAGHGHGDAVLVAGGDDVVVLHGAAGLGDVLDAEGGGDVDVVAEGEEGVRGEADLAEGVEVVASVGLGHLDDGSIEVGVEGAAFVGGHGVEASLDEADAGVDPVLALEAGLEGERGDGGGSAEPPGLELAGGELDAVEARLLAGADADELAVEGEGDRVGLGVLAGDGGEEEVAPFLGRDVGGGDDAVEVGGDEGAVVAALDEADAEDLPVLERCRARLVVRRDPDADELARLFRGEHPERVLVEARRDDAVRDLLLQDLCRGEVDDVRERDEVAERAQRVCLAGADVRGREWGQLGLADLVHGALRV